MFGLKRKKPAKALEEFPPVDAESLIQQQSPGRAIVGGVIAVVLFGYFWAWTAVVFGKVFPWLSIIQGGFVGLMIRRAGRGFTATFAAIAALIAWLGAIGGNFVIATMTTSDELGVSMLEVLMNLTSMTFGVFFTETFNIVDHIYALTAAAIAAFYAVRKLNRREVLALRTRTQAKH